LDSTVYARPSHARTMQAPWNLPGHGPSRWFGLVNTIASASTKFLMVQPSDAPRFRIQQHCVVRVQVASECDSPREHFRPSHLRQRLKSALNRSDGSITCSSSRSLHTTKLGSRIPCDGGRKPGSASAHCCPMIPCPSAECTASSVVTLLAEASIRMGPTRDPVQPSPKTCGVGARAYSRNATVTPSAPRTHSGDDSIASVLAEC